MFTLALPFPVHQQNSTLSPLIPGNSHITEQTSPLTPDNSHITEQTIKFLNKPTFFICMVMGRFLGAGFVVNFFYEIINHKKVYKLSSQKVTNI